MGIKNDHQIRVKDNQFYLSPNRNIYMISFTKPNMHCVHLSDVDQILYEPHEGIVEVMSVEDLWILDL